MFGLGSHSWDKALELLHKIKHDVDEIECKLSNKNFGLEEIKREIREILAHCEEDGGGCDLTEVLTEIRAIEAKLDSSDFGLAEIKNEIRDIEAKLDSGDFGLAEIKSEIRDIEAKLDSGDFGLAEIKSEIRDIEAKLDSSDFGLAEIKSEIRDIEAKLDQLVPPATGALTTGAVVADNAASSLVVKVLNNTGTTQTIVITAFDIGTCPNPKTVFATTALTIEPGCARSVIYGKPPVEYEVEFFNIVPGVYVWTATRNQAQNAPLSSSVFIAANTFRHCELVPLVPTPA